MSEVNSEDQSCRVVRGTYTRSLAELGIHAVNIQEMRRVCRQARQINIVSYTTSVGMIERGVCVEQSNSPVFQRPQLLHEIIFVFVSLLPAAPISTQPQLAMISV